MDVKEAKASVLIVDEERERRRAYVALLEDVDIDVVQAESGDAALCHLDECEFAAVLLDGRSPGMGGLDAATRIRAHPRGGHTPIVFITDSDVKELDLVTACAMEAVDYVQVPVLPDVLRAKIRVLLELHDQQLKVARLNEQLVAAHAELAKMHDEITGDSTQEVRALNESLAQVSDRLQSEIADRRRVQRLFTDAAQRNEDFISALAHELRNPLSAIQSGIELIRIPSLPSGELAWARELVERQFRLLVRMIDDLLDASRVTRGRVELKKEVVDLRSIVADSVAATTAQIEQRRHAVALRLPDQPLYVEGDAARLRQIFTNLLLNAAKYMAPQGRIEVIAEPLAGDPERVAVHVHDEGRGLEADMLEPIFELFARVDSSGRRAPGGLGIGLALVRGLVELHGGAVRARSEGLDQGSEFTVELPRAVASANAPVAARQRPRTATGLELLIVDHDADAADEVAAQFARISPRKARIAHDGDSALAAARESVPDAILLDLALPDEDGFRLARRLRGLPGCQDVVIVAMTDADRAPPCNGSFAQCLNKPVALPDLEQVLARCNAELAARRATGPAATFAQPGNDSSRSTTFSIDKGLSRQ